MYKNDRTVKQEKKDDAKYCRHRTSNHRKKKQKKTKP